MKPTEITMQIVKNLGNYETCRLEATYTLDDNDDLTQAFVTARKDLETAFAKAYEKPKEQKEKQPEEKQSEKKKILTFRSPEFERVCKALAEGRTDIEEVKKFFILGNDVIDFFNKHDLI